MNEQSKTSPDTTEPSKKQEASLRWWEFYAVRYAMGTVVGAIIFYFLCLSNNLLMPLLFDTATISSGSVKLETAQLALLGAYGLVYCYVASAPILVFHAGRFLLKLDVPSRIRFRWLFFIFVVPVVVAIAIWMFSTATSLGAKWFLAIASFLAALILWLEIIVVVCTLLNNKDLYLFYEKLAFRRETAIGGITDSYRHLREHGDSFFIVLLEIVLAFALFAAGIISKGNPSSVLLHVSIIVLWILPAVFVWLIGTLFERRFNDGGAEPPAAADSPQAPRR
jgi:hypothetical protein